jgi:hypothetical protein
MIYDCLSGLAKFLFYIHDQVYNSVFTSVYNTWPLNLSQPNPFTGLYIPVFIVHTIELAMVS